jgi:hypothetical protein
MTLISWVFSKHVDQLYHTECDLGTWMEGGGHIVMEADNRSVLYNNRFQYQGNSVVYSGIRSPGSVIIGFIITKCLSIVIVSWYSMVFCLTLG